MAEKRKAGIEKNGGGLTLLFAVVFLAFALVFSGCDVNVASLNSNDAGDDVNSNPDDGLNVNGRGALLDVDLSGGDEVRKFESKEELVAYLNKVSLSSTYSNSYGGVRMMKSMDEGGMVDSVVGVEMSADVASESPTSSSGGVGASSGAQDYSGTNNQVENVDESDIIKNDGKYIYTLSQNKIVIVEAFPAEEMMVVSTIEFEKKVSPRNIFINGDKLVVLTGEYKKVEKVSDYDFVPYETRKEFTHIYVYDVSDKNDVKELKDFSVSGSFNDARMIGDVVYVVSKEYVNLYRGGIDVPVLFDGVSRIASPDIYYFDMPFNSYNYHTVSSFDLDSLEAVDSKTFMLGYSNTLYVSEDSIYISYPKNYGFSNYRMKAFFDVVMPLLPQEVQDEIKPISNPDEILEKLEDYYNSIDEDVKKDLVKDIRSGMDEFQKQVEIENSKTYIHKISIKDGKIEYDTKGEVKGHLLNQFSFDEKDGNLRVATTTSMWLRNSGRVSYSNVFVLDSEMKVIGELKELAEDERIYSTRFMGDKLYMVTFKQVDPLFVIDLSEPTKPKVLGKLKIPGFSNYLHPFDETHLIGIGKDTKESKWSGVITTGVKLSLFDVGDFDNPREVDSYVIEGRWTDSPALHDHKAFLFDKGKELLVLPVREFVGDEEDYSHYEYEQSAHVFTVTENGFELRGKVTHEEKEDGKGSWWYNSPSAVQRSLYMDNVLYTVSEKLIKANDLDSVDAISEVDLGYEEFKSDDDYRIYY